MEPLELIPFYTLAEAWVRRIPSRDKLVAFFSLPLLLFQAGALRLAPRLPGVSFPHSTGGRRQRRSRPKRPLFAVEWHGLHPSFVRSFEGWSYSPEVNVYSYDFMTFILVLISVITGFYIATWISTQLVLAVKAVIELAILGVSMAGMSFFSAGISQAMKGRDPVFVFVTDIDGRALSTGVVVFAFLVVGQLFVFTGLPVGYAGLPVSYSLFEIAGLFALLTWLLGGPSPSGNARTKAYVTGAYFVAALVATAYLENAGVAYLLPGAGVSSVSVQSAYSVGPLSSVMMSLLRPGATYTIQPNTQLVGLFYTEAAITETFFFQGFEYVILASGLTGFDPSQMTWKKHIVASSIVVATAGILHESVYQLSVLTIFAVMVGFAIINLSFELSDALNTAIIAHVILNIVSTVGGSAISFTPGTLNIMGAAGIAGIAMSFALLSPLGVGFLAWNYIPRLRRGFFAHADAKGPCSLGRDQSEDVRFSEASHRPTGRQDGAYGMVRPFSS